MNFEGFFEGSLKNPRGQELGRGKGCFFPWHPPILGPFLLLSLATMARAPPDTQEGLPLKLGGSS